MNEPDARNTMEKGRITSFWKFMFNRTGFGRTSWFQFALIEGLLLSFGLLEWFNGMWVGSAVAFVCVNALLLFGTWRNYKGKQA